MATEILRPNAAGDSTTFGGQTPGTGYHWDKVDEFTADNDTTRIESTSASGNVYLYLRIKENGTTTSSDKKTLTTDYATYTKQWTVRPSDSQPFTWDDIDALQIGVRTESGEEDLFNLPPHAGSGTINSITVTAVAKYYNYGAPNYGPMVTQLYVSVDCDSLVPVTTQACSAIQTNGATGNGTIVYAGDGLYTERGFCYIEGDSGDPDTDDDKVYDTDSYGTGAYTKAITGLSTATAYRVRAYAINPIETRYGETVDLVTLAEAPTNCAATKGDHYDKVVVTWTKSTGATGYRVFRDDADVSGLLGDVATYDDTGADAPTITPGSAVATRGKRHGYVRLTISGLSYAAGTTHEYYVKAVTDGGDSAASNSDYGYINIGTLTYQWQRSAADSDASYSNITGAVYAAWNDTGAPAYGSGGRYYKCVLNATGAAQQATAVARGYRKSSKLPSGKVNIVIKDTSGNTLYYLKNFTAPSTDYRVNKLAAFSFRVAADDPAREYLVYPNEAWLYIDGILQDIFKITVPRRVR